MAQSLRVEIGEALKEALKSQNKNRLSTLRLIQAAIKDRDIAARTEGPDSGVSDDAILEVLSKMIKQRRDSVTLYEQGGRMELAEKENEEIAVIEGFMPKQMSDDEIRAVVDAVIGELGATGLKDMGKVMAELKKRHAGEMDFAKAGGAVKAKLA
ncbi:MAG: GatB/YqeY domain-containing protein [Rhizobiales bacterium]|nr:GatB/YqeY domain-containing protein [Hyphomicrobiales bacterium]